MDSLIVYACFLPLVVAGIVLFLLSHFGVIHEDCVLEVGSANSPQPKKTSRRQEVVRGSNARRPQHVARAEKRVKGVEQQARREMDRTSEDFLKQVRTLTRR